MRRLLLFSLLLLPLGAVAWSNYEGADRSLAVYPKQEIPLRFDHALHLEDMACSDCHEASASKVASDRMIPGHPTCEGCHDVEAVRGDESCQMCHPGFDPTAMARPKPVVIPTANLKFDHAVHVSKEIPCARCHGAVEKVQIADRRNLPKMETCLECHHRGSEAGGACSVCHPVAANGKIAKVMPSGATLVPELGNPFGVYHSPDYARAHGQDAFTARETCDACHTESECLACHDAAIKVLKVHPNDWITLHPVPAKHSALECQSCHNYQDFCVTCHERVGIGQQAAPQLRATNLSVHPPGWVGPLGPNHHGVFASRDIRSCTSCHREEGCIQCHATTGRGGVGSNPHPPGFSSKACSLYEANARVCIKCHAPADPMLARCR
ncbi:cytochrome c3 family protein [Vulgatibacter sp.]|uniref:cytochrome c3 family protein n=1 Tax=Vulgatibacter sp. TaxID=1971226 RepID=UPI00356496D0